MAQYDVVYNINVNPGNSIQVIDAFKTAINGLTKPLEMIANVERRLIGMVQTLGQLSGKKYTIDIRLKGSTAETIEKRAIALERLNAALLKNAGTTKNVNSGYSRGGSSGGNGNRGGSGNRGSYTPRVGMNRTPSNLGYKLFGPTPLPSNGGMAVEMLKGMGVMYGIMGLGSGISSIISQASEYDNLMKTVENILKSHDDKGNFSSRFSTMSQIIREVGMETKYKVTEVADAAKFLAMAGLDLEAIQTSIRPIADIALVGDTELGETADMVTNIMTAYNIAPNQMRRAADIMTNTFTMSNTTLSEIAESYKYAASLLSAGGIDFSEATAAIGVLGDAGIKGSQAGTTMRTILANLVNPTKRQKAAWEEIGVQRMDSEGNLRSLTDIFNDLSKADLSVDYFYRLFHKTAASGAVALASHVDKWQDVMFENMMSAGISKRLADEKKNTIQGLWAQMTSIFTDRGVTAFGGIQSVIRDYMSKMIDYMKGDEFQKIMHRIFDTLIEFIKIMKQVSQMFFWFFNNFGGWIAKWMKFQLYIWPVVKAVTALKTAFLGLAGLKRMLGWIPFVFNQIRTGGASIGASAALAGYGGGLTMGGRQMTPYGFMAGSPYLPYLSWTKAARLGYGLRLARPHWLDFKNSTPDPFMADMAYQRAIYGYKQDMKRYNRRIMGRQVLRGAGSVAGMASAMFGISEMMNENNSWAGKTAGGFLTGAGIAATIATGPVGWGIAGALAGLAGAFGLVEHFKRMINAARQVKESLNNLSFEEGRLINEKSSDVVKYLNLIQQKHMNIDEVIKMRIAHQRELLGLESTPVSDSNAATTDTLQSTYNNIKNGGAKAFQKFVERQDLLKLLGLKAKLIDAGPFGSTYAFALGDETHGHVLNDKGAAGILGIANEAVQGKFTNQLITEIWQNRAKYLSNFDVEGLNNYQKELERKYKPDLTQAIDYNKYKSEEFVKNLIDNPAKLLEDPLFKRFFWNVLNNQMNFNQPFSGGLKELSDTIAQNGDIVSAFINVHRFANLQGGFTFENFDPDNPYRFFKDNGWTGSSFTPLGENKTKVEQAQTVVNQFNETMALIRRMRLNELDDPQLKKFIEVITQLYDNAIKIINLSNGFNDPNVQLYDTIDYMGMPIYYTGNGMWRSWSDKNVTFPSSKVTPKPMPKKSPYDFNLNTSDNDDIVPNTPAVSSEDYLSSYRNNNAVPRTVNISFDNLLTIDEVSLSDPNNMAFLDNIKPVLANALIDVLNDTEKVS